MVQKLEAWKFVCSFIFMSMMFLFHLGFWGQSLSWPSRLVNCWKFDVLSHNPNILTRFLYFLPSEYIVCTPVVLNQWPIVKHNGFLVWVFSFLLLWTTQSKMKLSETGRILKNQKVLREAKQIWKPLLGTSKWMHVTGLMMVDVYFFDQIVIHHHLLLTKWLAPFSESWRAGSIVTVGESSKWKTSTHQWHRVLCARCPPLNRL